MLQPTNKRIATPTKTFLNKKQQSINSKVSFVDKTIKAHALWDNKTNSKVGLNAFKEVKDTLLKMTAGVELCNYCEQSEAMDIEHILPKSLFPQNTFIWSNYVLACKNCNTGYKLDKMWIFNPKGSVNIYTVLRGTQPATTDTAFINLRVEDPLSFMQLDFTDFLFYAIPPHSPGTQGFAKVEKTLEVLRLNTRTNLVRYRQEAFNNFKKSIREYVDVKNSIDHNSLSNAISGYPAVDTTRSFQSEKKRILISIKRSILTSEHPTVWHEMVRQQNNLSAQLRKLFIDSGALSWA